MIGGAPIGAMDIGSFPEDNYVRGVSPPGVGLGMTSQEPSYSFTVTPPGVGLGMGDPGWKMITVSVPPGIGLGVKEYEAEVNGSIQVTVVPPGIGLGVPTLPEEVVLSGWPEFYISRSGTDVTITVTNRDQETVRVFRAEYNGSWSEIDSFSADTYVDTIPDATKTYKYKLAWYVPVGPIYSRRSDFAETKP